VNKIYDGDFIQTGFGVHPTHPMSIRGSEVWSYIWTTCIFMVQCLIMQLQSQRPGFDSRHYQKKKKNVVGLERGALSLVSTTEELLDRKIAAPVLKTEKYAGGIRHADHVAPYIRTCWQSLRRQAAVARSVYFARGLRPWSLVFFRDKLTCTFKYLFRN
jgi:hypothetical protein